MGRSARANESFDLMVCAAGCTMQLCSPSSKSQMEMRGDGPMGRVAKAETVDAACGRMGKERAAFAALLS